MHTCSRSLISLTHSRELGRGRGQLVRHAAGLRDAALELSTHLELASAHAEEITALSLDYVDARYLLSSSGDGAISLWDVEDRLVGIDASGRPANRTGPTEPLCTLSPGNNPDAHSKAVTCVQWFPQDTGLFATGGLDSFVKLWDTNSLTVACDFKLPGRVHCLAMSPIATMHTLIATCSEGATALCLCDPATGSAAHRIPGHRASAWAVAWSPRDEHQLVSGGADRSVRVWDVRRAGSCLRALDMHDSVSERRRLSESVRGGALTPHAKPTTVPSAVREFAAPSAHSGAVTSLAFVGEGLMLLTAGRDHRLRLWDAQTGAHMLVHYAGAFNTARHTKQLAVSSGRGGGLGCARVFFPSSDGIAVYEVLTGRKVTTLKAHLGEVTCCVASPWDARVFSGGADCTVHAWTPPPCGLAKPAPCELPTRDTVPTGADGSVGVDDVPTMAPLARGAEAERHPATVELDDVDAWSDEEEEATVTALAPCARGRGRGQGGARKRHRSS